MPVINGQTSIPAGASVNLVAGSIWEFPDRNYYGRFAQTGDAAFSIRTTVQSGSRTEMEESQISGANRPPVLPDDLLVSRFPIRKGVRLVIKSRNTSAGAVTTFFNLHLDPA
jgi:hypothetical protein